MCDIGAHVVFASLDLQTAQKSSWAPGLGFRPGSWWAEVLVGNQRVASIPGSEEPECGPQRHNCVHPTVLAQKRSLGWNHLKGSEKISS